MLRRTVLLLAGVLASVPVAVAPSAQGGVPPNTSSWTTVAPMPTARSCLAVTAARDGRIFALGGGCSAGENRDTVEAYQPATDTWTAQAPMPTPRRFLTAATDRGGRIYAIGGVGPQGDSEAYTATVEAYTPSTNTWTAVAPMPTARAGAAAARGHDGRISVIGGCCDPANNHAFSTVEAYTPSTNTWSTVAPLPSPRVFLGAVAARNGRIYAIGGRLDDTGTTNCCAVTNVEAYRPAANKWESVAPLPLPVESHAVALGADGRIYAFGGLTGVPDSIVLDRVLVYVPSSNTWSAVASLTTARTSHGGARGADGRIYAVGGQGPIPGTTTFGIFDLVEALETRPGHTH